MSDTETGEACIGCNEFGRLEVLPTPRTYSSRIGTYHPLAVLICPRCREESPDRFRFCGYCGSPLTVGAITEERRTVTVLFADLVGFTTLSESLDHEDVARIQAAYFDAVAETVGRYGGRVQKFIGDAAVVLFGIPRVRDDDAHRAVRASLALVSSAEHLAPRAGLDRTGLRIRIGVNTGEVTYVIDAADPQGWRVTGDVVNTASRLQTMAEPGTVLLGELTALAVTETIQFEAVGALQLRGKAVPVRAFRAIGVRAEPSREHALGRLQASTIGRKQELGRLGAALARAFRGQPERWVILAPPGVGKSRLLEEFAERVRADDPAVPILRARARPDVVAPFDPVAQLVLSASLGSPATGIEPDRVLARVVECLLAAGSSQVRARAVAEALRRPLGMERQGGEETSRWADRQAVFAAWLEGLDALTECRGSLWLVEDAHWAGPDILQFLAFAGSQRTGASRLVLATARPSILERHPRWCQGGGEPVWRRPRVLALQPLAPVDAASLVRALVGEALPPGLVQTVVERSDGNPLFVEELLRSWITTGVLSPADGGWRLSALTDEIVFPSTVQALYSGQLDDLAPSARNAVRRVSVAGRRFPLAALGPLGVTQPEIEVDALRRRAFITGPEPDLIYGTSFVFRHALLRDAGYASLSRAERTHLHVAMARWLEHKASTAEAAVAELVGRHYAAALKTLPTVGAKVDGLDRTGLAQLAAAWFERAALSALRLAAYDASALLLQRALEFTPEGAVADRARRLRRLGDAVRRTGDLDRSMEAFREAAQAARWIGDAEALARAAIGYEEAEFHTRRPREPVGDPSVLLLQDSERVLAGHDSAIRAELQAALGRALAYAGDADQGSELARQSIEMARRLGDDAVLARALLCHRAGRAEPEHLPERLAEAEEMVEAARRTADREMELESRRLWLIDQLEAGDLTAANQNRQALEALNDELAEPLYRWYTAMWRAMWALFDGRLEDAERSIYAFLDEGRRWGYQDVEEVFALQLLILRRDQGRIQEVRPYLEDVAHRYRQRRTWGIALALTYAELGQLEAARAQLGLLAPEGFEAIPRNLAWSSLVALVAEVCALTGQVEEATALYPRLVPWAGHNIVTGSAALCFGSASRYLGLLAAQAGDLEQAVAYLEEGLAKNRSMGARPQVARSYLNLAEALLRRGRAGDPDRALDLLARAALEARSLGMTALATRAEDAGIPVRARDPARYR
jgi:class 3 adenylate cyclase/tetratricopeptide (TPR) repeat protein